MNLHWQGLETGTGLGGLAVVVVIDTVVYLERFKNRIRDMRRRMCREVLDARLENHRELS